MANDIGAFVVTLARDVRSSQADRIKSALEQIVGVASVDPYETNIDAIIERGRVRNKLVGKLLAVLHGEDADEA